MLHNMKKTHLSQDKKGLLSNFFSLSLLQGVNMLLPLVTFPYLVRVLGVEIFGLLNVALAVIMYFNILVTFGFELSATREISIYRNDLNRVSQVFSGVIIIKAILIVVSILILTVLIFFIDAFRDNTRLYYYTFGIIIGNAIFPSWFFQGIEKMKYITYVNVVSKSIFTGLVFLLIREESDYLLYPILTSLGAIVGGAYAFWLAFKLYSIRLYVPKKEILIKQVQDSFQFFLSRVANNGSRYFATTLIGLYFGNVVVGYYSIAEKLFYAFNSLGSVVSQTIYPYMSRTRNIALFKKILIATIVIATVVLVPILYFNEALLFFVFDIKSEMLSGIFVIIMSSVIFAIISAIVGYPLLAAFGFIKYANMSLIYASIVYVIYTSAMVLLTDSIYMVSTAIPVYMITGLILRVYYIKKSKVLVAPIN